MPTPIITDGSMDRVKHAPKVVMPAGASLFKDRAARFAGFGSASDMGGYMRLMAHVCAAQGQAYGARSAPAVAERSIANSREHGMPPLSAHVFPRDASWRDDLRDIVQSVKAKAEPDNKALEATLTELGALLSADVSSVEAMADRVISGMSLPQEGAKVPFIGAALQVYFTRMAASMQAQDVSSCDVATVCPCCGMRPTVSVVRLDPERMNYRYLVCSLCQTEWNLERVKCTSCEEEKGIAYLIVEQERVSASDAAVRAETCDECKTYLKILVQEKDPSMDPFADDLNTLALDMLVDEKGYARTGPNLLFYPGQE